MPYIPLGAVSISGEPKASQRNRRKPSLGLLIVALCCSLFFMAGCGEQLNLSSPGAAAILLKNLACGSSTVAGATNDSCSVNLSAAASNGGLNVTLTSSSTAVSVPASVNVASGQTSTAFTAQISKVTSAQSVTLTASAGSVVKKFTLLLNPTAGSVTALSGLTCKTNSLTGTASDNCMVSLSAPAPSGGFSVSLASNNSAVTAPTSVSVPQGSTSVSFTVQSANVSSVQNVTLTASAQNVTQTYLLTLSPPPTTTTSTSLKGLTCGNSSVIGPVSESCTVTLSTAAGSGGFNVSLTSSSAAASVPASVTVPAGAIYTTFTAQAASVSSPQSVTLTASAGNITQTYLLLVNPPSTTPATLSGLTCGISSLTGVGSDGCIVSLSAAAGSGGFTVSLASSSSAVSVPGSITVPAGSASASFAAQASSVSSAQTVTLTAQAGSISKAFTLQLNAASAVLVASPTALNFGTVATGSTSTQSLTLLSNGTAPLTITAATIAGTGYSISGGSLPITINPGQTATINVKFAPTTAAASSGSLTITSNASSGSATVVPLAGTGATVTYEVSLSWVTPTSASDPAVSYDVYREISGGSSYQLINSSPISSPSYIDTTVLSGSTYTYYVVSMDASGNQSSPSTTYTAVIP